MAQCLEEMATFQKAAIFFLLSLQVLSQLAVAVSHSRIKFLPGFEGPLPFELETGYVGVDESEDVQLFYYFVNSQGNAKKDPLMLWLTGGPGCSAFSAFAFEIGPLNFKVQEYNGSIPTLVLNPHSWAKEASIIFVDSPVGTGFSYARTPLASKTGDFIQIKQLYQFLRKWLMEHPEFISRPVYIGGDSYSGKILPAIVKHVLNGIKEGIKPLINFKGYILGNPFTDETIDSNALIPFAYGMGLISYENYEALKSSCGGEYVNIDPKNFECWKHKKAFDECLKHLNTEQILEPWCAFASPKPRWIQNGERRSLNEGSQDLLDSDSTLPTINCRSYGYLLSRYWANENSVRKALHIKEGSIRKWKRCNNELPYSYEINSSVKYHAYLGSKGYPSLIYSGDHDKDIPFVGTQEWIKSLNYSIIDDWRPWNVQGQVAGYTRTYSNKMTYATLKGGGHTAPEYRPKEAFAMFKRWIHQEPL